MQYNIGVYDVKGLVNMGTVLFQLCSTILVYMMLKGWSPWAQSCFPFFTKANHCLFLRWGGGGEGEN